MKMMLVERTSRTFASQWRCAPASRHKAFLIARFTKMRETTRSSAAARTTSVCVWVELRIDIAPILRDHVERQVELAFLL